MNLPSPTAQYAETSMESILEGAEIKLVIFHKE